MIFQTDPRSSDRAMSDQPESGREKRRTRAIAGGVLIAIILSITGLLWGAANVLIRPDAKSNLDGLVRGGEYLDNSGVVMQQSSNDCGVAALKMVFDHHHIVRPLGDWAGELMDRPEGTSMLRMKEVTEKWGLRAEGWRVSSEDINSIPLPSIALMNRRHYVVIESIQETGDLIFADPSSGRFKMKLDLFLSKTRGEMLLISKE